LQDVTIPDNSDTCFAAKQKITVAGGGTSFVVENGSAAILIAGKSIYLQSHVHIEAGAYFRAYIDETGTYCNPLTMLAAKDGEDNGLVNTTSDAGKNRSLFSLYPNPTSGMLTVELKHAEPSAEVLIEVYSIVGERLSSTVVLGKSKHQIDLSGKTPGVYIVRLVHEGETGFKKIIKR
jgi:hypothetical protein